MKQTILTLVVLITATTFCDAQKIETKKGFWGHTYHQEGKRMTMKTLTTAMKSDNEAYQLMKKAKTNYGIASVIGGAGGFMFGYGLGAAITGNNPDWALLGIGAGLVVVSLPITKQVNKQTAEAIDMYNAFLESSSSYQFKPKFQITAKSNVSPPASALASATEVFTGGEEPPGTNVPLSRSEGR